MREEYGIKGVDFILKEEASGNENLGPTLVQNILAM